MNDRLVASHRTRALYTVTEPDDADPSLDARRDETTN
jgi:hypothetical protein